MAKNKITIDVMVNGKMEKATVSAKKLRKELANADAAQQGLNTSTRKGYRAAQGSAQNTANSTKAFSKQAGVVGGLVPIYATFAANVFAVSAAFGVLSRNAAVQQLETSLNNIGIAAGRNLPQVASNLKDITGGAISTEAALRATAVATTSGFSTKQLQDLTKVATGASIALGRNLPDALDRLVRGTAKLEPEILDELGIIVRLDQATREYAASIGKTAQELTQFERQQAFLNATIDQGLSKYEKIAQAVDPNPYDRLSAAFTDLLKSSVELANKGLVPIIEFLSESPTALFAALGLFSTTIVSQIIPAISDMAAASADRFAATAKDAKKAAKKITNEYADAAKGIQTYDFMPKGFRDLAPTLRKGTKDVKVYDKALKSLKMSETRRLQEIEKVRVASANLSGFQKQASQQYIASKEAELEVIQLEIERTRELQRIQQQGFIGPVVVGGGSVQAAQKEARVTGARARSQDIEKQGLDDIGAAAGPLAALGVFASTIPQFIDNLDDLEGATEKTKQGFRSLGSAGKLLGAVFSRLLGPLSLALLAYSVLGPVIKDLFFKEDKLQKVTDEVASSFNNVGKIVIALKKELVTLDNKVTETYRRMEVAAGITDQTSGALSTLQDKADELTLEKLNTEIESLLETEQKLVDLREAGAKGRGYQGQYLALTRLAETQKQTIDDLLDSLGKVPASNALVVLTKKFKILESSGATKLFPEIRDTYTSLIDELKKKKPGELVELDPLIERLDDSGEGFKKLESATKASAQALQEFDAARAKLTAGDRSRYSQSIKAGERYVNELTAQIQGLEGGMTADMSQFGGLGSGTQVSQLSESDQAQAKFLEKQLDLREGSIELASSLLRFQKQYNSELLEAEDTLVTHKGTLKEQETILKRINNLVNLGGGFIESQLQQEDEVRKVKIEVLEAQQALNSKLMETEEANLANKVLTAEINALKAEENNIALRTYRTAQDEIKLIKEQISLEQKKLDVQKRQNDVARRRDELTLRQQERARNNASRTAAFTAEEDRLKDQLAFAETELKRREAFIKAEANMKKANVALEFMLLDAKYAFLEAEARNLAASLRAGTKNADGTVTAASPEQKELAEKLEGTAEKYKGIAKKLGINDLKVTVGSDGSINLGQGQTGLLNQIFGVIDQETTISIDELNDKITDLKDKLGDFDTVEMALQAGFDAMSTGFSNFFTDVVNGTKSVKDAFADLANSILQSMQKVFADKVAQQFMGFLEGKLTGENAMFGGFFSKFFKPSGATEEPKEKTAAETAATTTGGGFMSPTGGGGALAQSANAEKPPTAADAAMQSSTPGSSIGTIGGGSGGLDGLGLGASSSNPVYVTMVEGITSSAPGGQENSQEKGGSSGSGAAATKATEEGTAATKELTVATVQSGLQTASAVTAGLATVAALTGNEKAAKKLAVVMAVLQLAVVALEIAVMINTMKEGGGIAALFGARNGGVFNASGKNMAGYSDGGIAKGSQGGYPALLHGTEAVVPLPNGKSIPVEMSGGGGMQQNNVSVNVVMNSDGTSSQSQQQDGKDAAQLGKNISAAVQEEIRKQKRNGGMLSPYGSA